MRTPVRFLYSFLDQIFLRMVVQERECRNLGFKKIVKIVSPTSFEIVTRTHVRVLYSCSRLMVGHFEKVGLSMTLENIVKLGRLLYYFLIHIFLLWVVLEKKYMKYVEKFVNIVELERPIFSEIVARPLVG